MRTETRNLFEDLSPRWILYHPGEDPEASLNRCLSEMGKFERGLEGLDFKPIENVHETLRSYGETDIIICYLCDSFVNWEGGQIYSARTNDGPQTMRLIEHFANKYSGLYPKLGISYSFEEIPFRGGETEDHKQMLLQTGCDQPQLLWRERYHIFLKQTGE